MMLPGACTLWFEATCQRLSSLDFLAAAAHQDQGVLLAEADRQETSGSAEGLSDFWFDLGP